MKLNEMENKENSGLKWQEWNRMKQSAEKWTEAG